MIRIYNQHIESLCTRVLYFFNTVDTYFLVAGISTFALVRQGDFQPVALALTVLAIWGGFKVADFSVLLLALSPLFLFFLLSFLSVSLIGKILVLNLGIFFLIQFLFMSVPDAIVSRDPGVCLRLIKGSFFTIAQTTMSLPVSLFYSCAASMILTAQPRPLEARGLGFWLCFLAACFAARIIQPKSFCSSKLLPEPQTRYAGKVIVLNIDGCRLDRFYEAKLPFLTRLQTQGTYFPHGIQTVYRALTNPAFASILTGTLPEIHGVRSNNLGQKIRVQGLPDIIPTKLYGSMHIKHFSKPSWDTSIVSLPTHGIYKSDEIMLDQLKQDLLKHDPTRLYIADLSEADFLAHAYGSESREYLDALVRADRRLESFFFWLKDNDAQNDTVVMICSDHGIFRFDHSSLCFKAERDVPWIMSGAGIKPANPLKFPASIMDIAPTICFLLGINYPDACRGRVIREALKQI